MNKFCKKTKICYVEDRSKVVSVIYYINRKISKLGVLTQTKRSSAVENNTYSIRNEVQSVNRLRALAAAIEKGLD